jgi:hypothetical protein|tara:strand:+ start:212 stop:463 length:252 start_codon:yes stop_codon:yes gene_type:complete
MEKVLLESKELDTVKEIQQTEFTLINQLGNIEYQIQALSIQKDILKQEIIKLQSKSSKFGDDLQDKYGDGNINIETGEFTKID